MATDASARAPVRSGYKATARVCSQRQLCVWLRPSLEEAAAVLGLLAMLEGRRARTAAQALADLLDDRTLMPAAEVLVRWADTR